MTKVNLRKYELLKKGVHIGFIINSELRTIKDKYRYFDLFIESEKNKIKVGYPYDEELTDKSKLGALIKRFGGKYGEVELEKLFIGRVVEFQVIHIINEKGEKYAEINPDSVELNKDNKLNEEHF